MTKSIRDLQRRALIEMLHFNCSSPGEEPSAWKLLILDPTSQRILSPLLKVNDLREEGVTLYMQLHSERQPISDVPAVYFVEPTPDNIARIIKDVNEQLYDSFYLNFTTSLPRSLLEELAYNTVPSGGPSRIAKAGTLDGEMDALMDRMSMGVFSSLLTLGGQAPLIYSSKGTSAELLGEKLDQRIRNYMANFKTNIFGSGDASSVEDSLQRPLLVVLDRNFDLAAPLKHSSTYNALVHDILKMRLNGVTVINDTGVNKVYDIDCGKDHFWLQNASLPFPNVAENVDVALNQYKADSQQITRGGHNLEELTAANNPSTVMSADELKMAIKVIPELTERKRIIDSHLQISMALLKEIRNRNLGDFFHIEQDPSLQTKAKILEVIRNPQGDPQDKLRLFLVFYLETKSGNDMSKEELAVFEAALREKGCDLRPLEYCKKHKSLLRMSSLAAQHSTPATQQGAGSGGNDSGFGGFGSRLTSGVLGNMLSSVKNLLPESADTPLTKLIEAAVEMATGASTGAASALRYTFGGGPGSANSPREDLFTIFDPKQRAQPNRATPTTTQRSAFNHLIVFIVGGSNYSEYNHLEEYLRKKAASIKMSLTFGTTDLITGADFLTHLGQLL